MIPESGAIAVSIPDNMGQDEFGKFREHLRESLGCCK
jgi:hypothetical protein